MKRPTRTLIALIAAAAFGGLVATALRDGLQVPAQAQVPTEQADTAAAPPADAARTTAVAGLPTAVEGPPLP
ncbi:MAG: heat-shock protein, partial [Luteimonas sp.]